MIKIIVTGAAGRMGISNIQTIKDDQETVLSGAVEFPEFPFIGKDAGDIAGIGSSGVSIKADIAECDTNADVIIDFSSADALEANVKFAVENKMCLVVGTTGLADRGILEKASLTIPVIWAPNYSVGINLLSRLTQIAGEVLQTGFDTEIIEAHHRMKKDSPSGTAIKLLNVLKEVYKTQTVVYGRQGMVGARPEKEIGVHAIRGGDIVGDHTVLFAGIGERIELTHKASSRATFSMGAIRAAKYLTNYKKGYFTMEDVLGF